jgi:hypothetical protein
MCEDTNLGGRMWRTPSGHLDRRQKAEICGVRQSMGLILGVENPVHSLAALHRSSLQLVTIPPTIVKAGEARD